MFNAESAGEKTLPLPHPPAGGGADHPVFRASQRRLAVRAMTVARPEMGRKRRPDSIQVVLACSGLALATR